MAKHQATLEETYEQQAEAGRTAAGKGDATEEGQDSQENKQPQKRTSPRTRQQKGAVKGDQKEPAATKAAGKGKNAAEPQDSEEKQTAKKPRGRKPKAAADTTPAKEAQAGSEEDEESPKARSTKKSTAKKPAGRQGARGKAAAGKKAAVKSEEEASEEEEEAAEEPQPETGKKGPARSARKPAAGRGAKRKAAGKKADSGEAASEEVQGSEEDAEKPTGKGAAAKKRRVGRPAKQPAAKGAAADANAEAEEGDAAKEDEEPVKMEEDAEATEAAEAAPADAQMGDAAKYEKEEEGAKAKEGGGGAGDAEAAGEEKEAEKVEGKGSEAGKRDADEAAANEPKQAAQANTEDIQRPFPGSAPDDVLEEGRVYFLYRPRVNVEHPESVTDVQRFFMVLSPTSREGAPNRLLIIGKKRLPDVSSRERFYGFVEATADSVDALIEGLSGSTYETKTRGVRFTQPARIAGKGVYSIVRTRPGETRFVFRLVLPEQPGEVQEALHIPKEGSYLLSIKNPDNARSSYQGISSKAEYPESKKELFGQRAWIPAEDPSLLDYQHSEFLLIGAHDSVKEQTGDAGERVEADAAQEAGGHDSQFDDDEVELIASAMRQELHADDAELPDEPAKTGEWE